jgi:hypothetical protein
VRVLVVAVSIAAVVAVAACGSSGGSGSSPTGTSSNPPPSSSSAPAPSTSSAPAPAPNSSAGASASDAAFCASVAKVGQQFSALTDKASDPAGLKKVLGTAAAYLATLKAQAPAEIEPAVADLATLLNHAKAALANPSKPDLDKLQALATALPQDAQKLETWAETHCHA